MKTAIEPRDTAAEDRTTEIYIKAARIFHEKGYDATSMGDLAQALEITKAGLYYYIRSKEELLFQIMNFGLDWLEEHVLAPARDTADPEQRLRLIIAAHGRGLIEGSHAIPILTDEMAGLTPPHRRHITTRKRAYFDLVRETLNALKRQGRLNAIDTTVATFSIFGMLLWLPRWYEAGGRLEARDVIDELTKLLLSGLVKAARPGDAAP